MVVFLKWPDFDNFTHLQSMEFFFAKMGSKLIFDFSVLYETVHIKLLEKPKNTVIGRTLRTQVMAVQRSSNNQKQGRFCQQIF